MHKSNCTGAEEMSEKEKMRNGCMVKSGDWMSSSRYSLENIN